MKRAIDLVVATVGLVLLLVLYPFIAVAIVLNDRGPILFKQVRVGRDQRPFTLYKFRTMAIDTGDRPSHQVNTAKITRAGRLLRRSKLDELPQLVNVLKGEMSLVGPRPCLPSQLELIAARAELGVFRVWPGITGLAQVAGLDMSNPAMLAHKDAQYCDSWTMSLDMAILWSTFVGKGFGDAAKGGLSPPG